MLGNTSQLKRSYFWWIDPWFLTTLLTKEKIFIARVLTRPLLFAAVPQIPAVPRVSPCSTTESAGTCWRTGPVGRTTRARDSTWERTGEATVTVTKAGSATRHGSVLYIQLFIRGTYKLLPGSLLSGVHPSFLSWAGPYTDLQQTEKQ